MNLLSLHIAIIIIALLSVAASFIPRFPAALIAYAALITARLGGIAAISNSMLIFWGLAASLVVALTYLQPRALTGARQGHAFVVAGTILGTLTGWLLSPTSAAIIVCSVLGAFFGALAFDNMPRGTHFGIASPLFQQYLCAKGAPAIVCCSMAALSIIYIL